MRAIPPFLAVGVLMAAGGMPARAEAVVTSGNPASPTLEIESQPCWFLGGYHLAVGVRYQRFRLRAQVIDSGRLDLEPFGIDNQKNRFRRSFDDGSFGVFADYFLSEHWYADVHLASNRWLLENKATSATDHLRTLDGGLGLGFQYFVWRIYIEPAIHVFFRERQSLAISGEEYHVPWVELNPTIRLGIRL